jgi:hypothetical protein
MRRFIFIAGGVLGLAAVLFLYPVGVLTLSQNGRVLLWRTAKPGDTFQLAFLHSVALSDVREFFHIDSEYRLVLHEIRFQGQGAGLPYNLAKGEQLHREGDWFRITGMQRTVPSVAWRVQSQWQDRFRFGHEPELNLSTQMGNGLVHIQAQKSNLAAWLKIFILDQGNEFRESRGE